MGSVSIAILSTAGRTDIDEAVGYFKPKDFCWATCGYPFNALRPRGDLRRAISPGLRHQRRRWIGSHERLSRGQRWRVERLLPAAEEAPDQVTDAQYDKPSLHQAPWIWPDYNAILQPQGEPYVQDLCIGANFRCSMAIPISFQDPTYVWRLVAFPIEGSRILYKKRTPGLRNAARPVSRRTMQNRGLELKAILRKPARLAKQSNRSRKLRTRLNSSVLAVTRAAPAARRGRLSADHSCHIVCSANTLP